MNRLPEILQTRMSVKERISVRKKLSVSASELELLELIGSGQMTLKTLADELGLSVRGVDKSAGRLVEQGHLVKIAGKLHLSKSCASTLNIELSSISYSIDRSREDEKTGIEQSYISNLQIEQSSMNDIELSSTFSQKQEQSSINQPKQEQSSTFSPDASHAHTHGGSSNNIILNFKSLKEEKNKEEKINPPNPLDKNEENKKEEMPKRVFSDVFKNRVAGMGLDFLLTRRFGQRKGKRLKRLPKRKNRKPPKVQPFVTVPEAWSAELKAAFTEWLAYKAEKRSVYKPIGLQGLIKKINNHPSQAVIWAIEDSISRNWQGFFPENYTNNGKSNNSSRNGLSAGANNQRTAGTSHKSTPVFDLEAILAAELGKGNSDQSGFVDTTFEYVD